MSLQVHNRFTGNFISEYPYEDEKALEDKFVKAEKAFENQLSKSERIAIFEKTISIMKSKVEELTKIAASEGGKPFKDSKAEVMRAINGVELGIRYMHDMKGEEIPMGMNASSENKWAFTVREPLGIVVSISAFNHPLNLTIHQTIPALAVGCPVIIKPARKTPNSCFNFVDILREAGLPEEWCQTIICERNVTDLLISDKRTRFVSFIGSSNVGWEVRKKLAPGAHIALEHGGVAPAIVDEYADVEKAIPPLLKASYYHAGQVCVSVQKIFVHQSKLEDFTSSFVLHAEKLKVGDPLDPETEVGPIINAKEIDRIIDWINQAKDDGAEILCGGNRLPNNCIEPTVVLNPNSKSPLMYQEAFGPVAVIIPFTNLDDAIKEANALPFVFQGCVFTENLDNALKVANKMKARSVMINEHAAFRVDWMPFGGDEESGHGTGGIPYSMKEMTREKMVVFKSTSL